MNTENVKRPQDKQDPKLRISVHARDIETEAEEYAAWLRRGLITKHFMPFEGKTLHVVELLEALAVLCRKRNRRARLFLGKLDEYSEKKKHESTIESLEQQIVSYSAENKRLHDGIEEVKKEHHRLQNILIKENVMYEQLLREAAEMWKALKRSELEDAQRRITT